MVIEEGKKPRLLVVDDEPSIRFVLDQYFTNLGWTVECASSFEEAMALLSTPHFDVAVLDLPLGKGVNGDVGVELIAHIGQRHPRTLSILLTGFGSPATRQTALALGAAAVVDKPVRLASLRELVLELVASRERQEVQGRQIEQ